MTATTIRVQMAQRKDTAANWTSANPILLSGEIGYETDTKKFKIGNGSTNWNSLAYLPIPDGSGNLTITGNLEIGSTGSLTFEGSTADGFETTLAVTNPTGDRTITLPDRSGTVITSGDTGTVTSTMLADGTIVNDDVNVAAAIAGTKISPDFGSQTVQTTGIFSHALGSAAAPTVTFTGDTNTGIYSPGADQVAISTNGTKRIEIQADGDIDIDNGGVFYDATNNRLAIGTTTPGGKLVVSDGTVTLQVDPVGGTGTYLRSLTSAGARDSLLLDASQLVYANSGSERFRCDSSGRLLVGTSSARGVGDATPSTLEVEGTSYNSVSIVNNTNDIGSPALKLGKSRGTSTGSNVIVQDGDFLGSVVFAGADGSDLETVAATISAVVDGTPGANDMPGRLVFFTTADGASSPTERWRYSNNGETQIRNMAEVFPVTDNACLLGKSGFRWSAVWAANGTIQTSDERTKTEILDATLGTDFVKSLRPVSYKWIEGGKKPTGDFDEDNNYIYESVPGTRTHWGFIAQEVKQAVDTAGVDFGGWVLTDKNDPDSQQALRYDQFIAPLTKALQEALAEIDVLKAKVTALESA